MEEQELTYGQKLVGLIDTEAEDEVSICKMVYATEIDRIYHYQKISKNPKQTDYCKKAINKIKNACGASVMIINFQ